MKERPVLLEGEKVRLVPLEMEDWELFYREVNDPEANAYLDPRFVEKGFFTKEEERKYFEKAVSSERSRHMAIVEKESGEIVGSVSIMDIERAGSTAEIGVFVFRRWWGKGIGTEAVKLATRFAFERMNMRLLYAWAMETNRASVRLLEKCGFKLVGRLKKARWDWKRKEYVDALLFQLLREEWEGL